jgi:hypothetical protein
VLTVEKADDMTEQDVHSAGDSDPSAKASPSVAMTEPVLVLTGIAVATELAAALALAARRPRSGLALGIGALATAIAGVRIRELVTPMARPHDHEGEPLTPLAAAEPERVVRFDQAAVARTPQPT